MPNCPKCGAPNGPAAQRCLRCGQNLLAQVQTTVICPACGRKVAQKEACLMCGAPLAGAAPAKATAPAPSPAPAAASAGGGSRELIELAKQAVRAGMLEHGLLLFDRALREQPGDAEALNGKGLLVGRLGRNEEALECFEAVLVQHPRNHGVVLNKALAEDNLGRTAAAITSYRAFLALIPTAERAPMAQHIAHVQKRIQELGG